MRLGGGGGGDWPAGGVGGGAGGGGVAAGCTGGGGGASLTAGTVAAVADGRTPGQSAIPLDPPGCNDEGVGMADIDDNVRADEFRTPAPGRWELDRSHFPGGTTPIVQWLMEESMEAGMRQVMGEVGVPADSVQARFVHGFMYTRLRPLVGGGTPTTRLPPAPLLKLVTRVHPEFRRRARLASANESGQSSLDVVRRWDTELKPSLIERNRAFQQVELAALSDAQLAAHVGAVLDHLRSTSELHFWLHGHDLGPIARYLHAAIGWGLPAPAALDALSGSSPSTAEPVRALAAIRALVDESGADAHTLDDVRAISSDAAELLDDYLAARGHVLVTGYDITSFTLAELPGAVVRSIRSAAVAADAEGERAGATLRAQVPESDRDHFDSLLANARAVMDMRDDNGPLTYQWPAGLLRLALLEVGRRLVAAGRIDEADHALDLTPTEACDPFGAGLPSGRVLTQRVARRRRSARLTPPDALGPAELRPPLDVLPPVLARAVEITETALAHLGMAGSAIVDPLAGVGIGSAKYRGRVCRAESADEALELLEPGDVLVVRATSPAFNTVLSIAGAVVTTDGGPMSHAAVLARELGIPAVIGARGALDLANGSEVEVDPVAGTVRTV